MLPQVLCQRSLRWQGRQFALNYLAERDHGWLTALLEEHSAFEGRKLSDLRQHLGACPSASAPKTKLAIACRVLERLCRTRPTSPIPAQQARSILFVRAARKPAKREQVLQAASAELGIDPVDLEAALFADLASERCLGSLPPQLTPARLAAQANLALAGSVLGRALEVNIVAFGNADPLARQARRSGLICVIERASESHRQLFRNSSVGSGLSLHISGPFALFRQSRVYARALSSLVPELAQCPSYVVSANCMLGARAEPLEVTLTSGDPLAAELQREQTTSRVGERFVRDFSKLTRQWKVMKARAPLALGRALLYPDFILQHRQHNEPPWYLEIAGFWTQAYLLERLKALRRAGLDRWLICVNEKHCCSQQGIDDSNLVLRYKGRLPAGAVLARLEGAT